MISLLSALSLARAYWPLGTIHGHERYVCSLRRLHLFPHPVTQASLLSAYLTVTIEPKPMAFPSPSSLFGDVEVRTATSWTAAAALVSVVSVKRGAGDTDMRFVAGRPFLL